MIKLTRLYMDDYKNKGVIYINPLKILTMEVEEVSYNHEIIKYTKLEYDEKYLQAFEIKETPEEINKKIENFIFTMISNIKNLFLTTTNQDNILKY